MTIKESKNVSILRNKLSKDLVTYLDSYLNSKVTHVDVVDFGSDAYFLAPPWAEKYGLVVLSHHKDALPLSIQEKNTLKSYLTSTTFAPYSLQKKWRYKWPTGVEFHYKKTGQNTKYDSASCIDFEQGQIVRQQYTHTPGTRCSVFASTPKGMAVIRSFGTESELAVWKESAEKSAESVSKEIDKAYPTKEKPYKVHLAGLDDCSYGITVATQRDALQVIDDLHKYGYSYIQRNMLFTN